MFQQPYIDIDEWRDKPVHHRYVHGGFKETDARFSFYFPPKERYQGRFFQHITPAPGGENLEQHATGIEDQIGFAIESGGYFIETNEGGPSAMMNPAVSGFRVNAAAAKYLNFSLPVSPVLLFDPNPPSALERRGPIPAKNQCEWKRDQFTLHT
jgi:hypothetical protein